MWLYWIRIFCLSVTSISFGSCAVLSVRSDWSECPKIGAIRWDAWYGEKDAVGQRRATKSWSSTMALPLALLRQDPFRLRGEDRLLYPGGHGPGNRIRTCSGY